MGRGLYDDLNDYSNSDFYPFHMPGHKRNPESGRMQELYRLDITEINGFDDLHGPESIIRDAQMRAAQFYHSEETYFLVNGSTAGILSAVSAVAADGKKLIIARNCHKAVYHAAFLNRMELEYVYPDYNLEYDIAKDVTALQIVKKIEDILRKEGIAEQKRAADLISAVVITSPTYEGITSKIREIAESVHQYGIPLIVDEAHGAHLGIHPAYPESAVSQGADVVIQSVHKTLPAPTQTALLHKNGKLVESFKLRKYLRIYQSSSPSYILMAGIDEAVSIAGRDGRRRLDNLLIYRNRIFDEIRECRHIRICPDTEPGKLVISVKNTSMSGRELYDELRENYHLQMEMAAGTYVIAILAMMDTEEGIIRLITALKEIDKMLCYKQERNLPIPYPNHAPVKAEELWQAYQAICEEADVFQAENKIAGEFACLYPPGIPILVPGEIINKDTIALIRLYLESGYTIQGIENCKIKTIIFK